MTQHPQGTNPYSLEAEFFLFKQLSLSWTLEHIWTEVHKESSSQALEIPAVLRNFSIPKGDAVRLWAQHLYWRLENWFTNEVYHDISAATMNQAIIDRFTQNWVSYPYYETQRNAFYSRFGGVPQRDVQSVKQFIKRFLDSQNLIQSHY